MIYAPKVPSLMRGRAFLLHPLVIPAPSVIPAQAGIQTPVCPCKQLPTRNLRAAEIKTPCVRIIARKPRGTLYTEGLDSRSPPAGDMLRGNDERVQREWG